LSTGVHTIVVLSPQATTIPARCECFQRAEALGQIRFACPLDADEMLAQRLFHEWWQHRDAVFPAFAFAHCGDVAREGNALDAQPQAFNGIELRKKTGNDWRASLLLAWTLKDLPTGVSCQSAFLIGSGSCRKFTSDWLLIFIISLRGKRNVSKNYSLQENKTTKKRRTRRDEK
jgi:hypothetical protein